MAVTTHVVDGVPVRLTDASPLVYSLTTRTLYVGLSAGRGQQYRVYNLMQRLSALTPESARDAHGFYRPDRSFEWDERFPVPDPLEEDEIRSAIEEALPHYTATVQQPPGLVRRARRRLRPLRAPARHVGARARASVGWIRPPRPPVDSPERVADLSQVEPYREFLTPNGFASACRYVLNYDSLTVNEQIDNDWWFCKSDWLEFFFRELAPRKPFVLFSSNSDRTIDHRFARYLRLPRLTAWFAANAAYAHPKLVPIPLGIGDPSSRYGHAGGDIRAAMRKRLRKARLLEVSFDVRTNPRERLGCLAATGLELDPPLPKPAFLERLASSYFCVAPRGNGIDTHRMWEALYVRTIPVVTRSLLTDRHPDLPAVVLDDWGALQSLELTPQLYERVWADFDVATLSRDAYVKRICDEIQRLRSSTQSADKSTDS